MTKNFTRKEMLLLKDFIRRKKFKVAEIRISFGQCQENDLDEIIRLLSRIWETLNKHRCSYSVLRSFKGFVKELVLKVDGCLCEPFLRLLCVAENESALPVEKLEKFVFLSVSSSAKIDDLRRLVSYPISAVYLSEEEFEIAMEELLLPAIRASENADKEILEALEFYDYGRQTGSRCGILSKSNVERHVALER